MILHFISYAEEFVFIKGMQIQIFPTFLSCLTLVCKYVWYQNPALAEKHEVPGGNRILMVVVF